jgi:hypothetical protein
MSWSFEEILIVIAEAAAATEVNIETVTEKLRDPHHFSFRVRLQADLSLCFRNDGTPCLWYGGKPLSE